MNRGFDQIMAALKEVEVKNKNWDKNRTVAYTLWMGYYQQKTSMALESILRTSTTNLEDLVDEIAVLWDGESYIAGALRAANNYAKENPHE